MNLIELIIEFLKILYLKTTTTQEPPREDKQEVEDDEIVVVDEQPKPPIPVEEPLMEIGLLWCPFALKRKEKMVTRGKYRKSYPEGAVIHFTAGRSAESSFQHGLKSGYCFFVIAEDGAIHQAFPLDCWGYHAGESFHKKLGNGVSKYLVGIELSNPGKLIKKRDGSYETWYGEKVDSKNVKHYPKQTKNIEAGYYLSFTEQQETSLKNLLSWLKNNNPSVFHYELVLGHDEVSPGRKSDPGGALSKTMEDFRSSLS